METTTFTVKQARVLAGMTQAEMAVRLGVCLQTYRKLEAHPERMSMLQAKAFCQSVARPIDSISFFA